MRSTKVVKTISIIFGLLVLLFGPFLLIKKQAESLFFVAFCNGFSWFSIILSILIIALLTVLLLRVFSSKLKHIPLLELIVYLGALILFAFTPEIVNKIHSFDSTLYLLGVISIILCSLFLLKAISELFDHNQLTVKDIVEIGIFVSLAVVLDLGFFKIRIGANGGSISLAMLPLFLVALRKGFYKGFVASGLVYGLITCLTDNYGIITFPFDYLLGFGSIAIIGLFRTWIFTDDGKITKKSILFLIIGYLLAITGRLFAATLSGIIIYKLNFGASIVYQLAYLGPSAGIVLAILFILYKPLLILNKRKA